jgi:hypothetical protein
MKRSPRRAFRQLHPPEVEILTILVFFSVYVLIMIAAAVGVFRWQKKLGTRRAFLAGGLVCVLFLLLFPLPGHGTIVFLFEVMLHELRSSRILFEQTLNNDRKAVFQAKLASRFKGQLPLPVTEQVNGRWRSFQRFDSSRGWYDPVTGLAWTGVLPLHGGGGPPGLEQARMFCADQEPRGFWTLPTEAELSIFWKAGGYAVSPLKSQGTVALLEDENLQTEMLTLRKGRNGRYAVRCVARGPGAPLSGYSRKDIPLADWNTYQLQKIVPGFPDKRPPAGP